MGLNLQRIVLLSLILLMMLILLLPCTVVDETPLRNPPVPSLISSNNVVLYGWIHNGDLFHVMPFIYILIKTNPNLSFTIYLYLQETIDRTTYYHTLLRDILEYNNCKLGYYNINDDNDSLWSRGNSMKMFVQNKTIYINLFTILLEWDNNYSKTNVEPVWNINNRFEFLKYFKNEFFKITGIEIKLDYNINDLFTVLPELDNNISIKYKNIIKNLKYEKNIFFYNQFGGWEDYNIVDDNKIINYILKTYRGYNIIVSKPTTTFDNTYCVEDIFDNKVTLDGQNLINNAFISNLCNIVFFRCNGGSEFILNIKNIKNKKVKYIYIGNKSYLPRLHNLNPTVSYLNVI